MYSEITRVHKRQVASDAFITPDIHEDSVARHLYFSDTLGKS